MQSMEHGTFLRLAGLLALYFIGYLWLVPRLAVILTLAIDPQAELINTYVLSCLYAVIIVLSLLLTKRQWKESLRKILKKPVSSVFKILFGAVCVLLLNVVLSMICSMLSGQVNSVNQEVIRCLRPWYLLPSLKRVYFAAAFLLTAANTSAFSGRP